MNKKTVAVIGAGVSGLAFTHRLQSLAHEAGSSLKVVLLEDVPDSGGVVSTVSREGFLIEKGPDAFLSEDPGMMELCRSLGLAEELIGTERANRKTFVVHRGRLQPLPENFYLIAPKNIPAFLSTPLFSPLGKLRMLAEPFIPRTSEADESVASFIRRRFGNEALERVGQPMIAGIYSGDPEELSMRSTMPRFCEAEDRAGSVFRGLKLPHPARGARYGLFVSFKKGMRALTDAMRESLDTGSLHTEFRAASVSRDEQQGNWRLVSERGEKIQADAVCLAVPAKVSAMWFRSTFLELAEALSQITYQSVATLNLAFDEKDIAHPLDGFGFVVPAVEKKPMMACTFVHRKFAGRAPEGKALLRVFVGGAFGRDTFDLPDADLENEALRSLTLLLGLRKKPLFSVLERHTRALPQYCVGHKELLGRIASLEKRLPGLVLIGSSYRGTGIPDCIREAHLRAEALWSSLKG